MTELEQQSQLERDVSTIDALDVLLRLGNNREKKRLFLVSMYDDTNFHQILRYLERNGYIEKISQGHSADYVTYIADFTQKGKEVYERIKQDAPNLFKGEPFFIVNPPKYTYEEFFGHKYELEREDEEEEEIEIVHDLYFGKTKEELDKIEEVLNRRIKIDNALHDNMGELYNFFHEHSELDPKSVLDKYHSDLKTLVQKISQEK